MTISPAGFAQPGPLDYSTHPAATPSTDPNATTIDSLPDDAVARILLHHNEPSCRSVCKRFQMINDYFMGAMWTGRPDEEALPQAYGNLLRKRTQRAYDYIMVTDWLKQIPKAQRDQYPSPDNIVRNMLQKEELQKAASVVKGQNPITSYLLQKNLIPQHQTYEENLANTSTWLASNCQSCTSLEFTCPQSLPEQLQGMPALRSLALLWAKMERIPSWLYTLPLTELSIPASGLRALSPDIKKLTALQKLNLCNNLFKTLPPELALLPNLEQVDLSYNPISLPVEPLHMPSLRRLFLVCAQITSIPSWLYTLPLTELTIADSGLTTISPGIEKMTTLRKLNFSSNGLTTIPPELALLPNLEKLGLENNPISLPVKPLHMPSLRSLTLGGPNITSLPAWFYTLPLTELTIMRSLTALSPDIKKMTSLQKLDLAYNKLTAIPPELALIPHLQEVDLSYNPIILPDEPLHMPSLRRLFLLGAQIPSIPSWFYTLALTELSITASDLTALSPDIQKMTSLRKLDLSRNKLTTIPAELALLPNLEQVDLRRNPIDQKSIPDILKPLIKSGKILLGY